MSAASVSKTISCPARAVGRRWLDSFQQSVPSHEARRPGTLCWNELSQRLPTALAGQLIVFETLAALTYAFILRGAWPEPVTLLGIGLLIAGVMRAVRIRPQAVAGESLAA